jgi:RHS repeat-associated protein
MQEVRDPAKETVVHARYQYDGHARRVLIEEEGEQRVQVYGQAGQYLFEEPDLISDASFSTGESEQGKPSTRYQYLGNMLIARSSGTQTTYLHTDHLGSPMAESSVGPTVEVTHLPLHEPYGAPSNGTYLDGPGYTGHVVDGLTGLSYMQARYYDPVAGRFLGVDPVGVDLGSGGNFNRYWYGNDNPYRFVDPNGMWVCSSDQRQCNKFESALQRASDAAKSDRISPDEQTRLQRSVDFYGEKGDDSVKVEFGDLGQAGGRTERTESGHTVTLDSSKASSPDENYLARTVAHEGEHGANSVERGRDVQSLGERLADEVQGYTTGAVYQKATNFATDSNAGWTPIGGLNEENILKQAEGSVRSACSGSDHASCK